MAISDESLTAKSGSVENIGRLVGQAGEIIGVPASSVARVLGSHALYLGSRRVKHGGSESIVSAYGGLANPLARGSLLATGTSALDAESHIAALNQAEQYALRVQAAIALLGLSRGLHGGQTVLTGQPELLKHIFKSGKSEVISNALVRSARQDHALTSPRGVPRLHIASSELLPGQTEFEATDDHFISLITQLATVYYGCPAVLVTSLEDTAKPKNAIETSDLRLTTVQRKRIMNNYEAVVPYPIVDALRLCYQLKPDNRSLRTWNIFGRLLPAFDAVQQQWRVDPWQAAAIMAMTAMVEAQKPRSAATPLPETAA